MTELTSNLFNRAMNVMGKSMGLRLARHSMASTNLANMDTPGYKVRHIKFEKTLQQALGPAEGQLEVRQTHNRHMPVRSIEKAYVNAQKDIKYSPYGQDEKGKDILDIDKEMTSLAKNNLIYNATVQMLAKQFEGLKTAINEGGR